MAAPRPLEPLYPNSLIMKGDAQKADNAVVPDHLWLGMFASGYGSESCLTHHRLALGRPSASSGGLRGLWLGEGNDRVQDFWVATLAATTLKRFLQVEERERAATDTPTNTKSDGEEPQEVEGWGR